ncbi:hypothetical protein LguiA_016778 [Lonicera macranthoides]
MSSSSSSNTLTLKSSDGTEFVVKESIAIQSVTIKNMVDDNCATTTIPLPNVDGKTLQLALDFCTKHADKNVSEDDLKKFDSEFVEKEISILFDLAMAANYLDIKDLMDLVCQKIADEIKDMMPEQARKIFNIENDFTPEEEAKLREEHAWAFEI